MKDQFKEIEIGLLIQRRITECGIEMSRICNFFGRNESEIKEMLQSKSLDSEILLNWSKLLKYDFFRIYSQNLIFYSPPSTQGLINKKETTGLPVFKKNIYTPEIINFILDLYEKEEMSLNEIVDRYRIPKSTLYKWIKKYSTQ